MKIFIIFLIAIMMLIGISWAYFQFLPAIASELLKPVGEALPCLIEAKDQVAFTGPFGDSFGALTSIFSGLTLAGLITTIFLQSSEMHQMQRDREKQEESLQRREKEIMNERFENTFFKLLEFYNQNINNIEIERGRTNELRTYRGREAVAKFIPFTINKIDLEMATFCLLRLEGAYIDSLKSDYKDNIRSIIQSVDTLIRVVHNSQIADKPLYFGFLRSQLTDSDSFLLLLFAHFDQRLKSLKSLIEEYALLENLDEIKKDYAIKSGIYKTTAFGKEPTSS